MLPYIITFGLTFFFTAIAEKSFKKNKKIKGILASIIAILIPTILAGCRDENVGTDVTVYVTWLYKSAVNNSILSSITNSNLEFLFTAIVAIVSKIFKNFNIVLFTIQLLITVPIYYTLYENRKNASMSIGMLTYLLIFYNQGLNAMRQNIAIAIIFWGSRYIFKRKAIKYFITVLIASLFHSSAILTVIMYFIFYLINSENKRKYLYTYLIYIVLIGILVNYNNVLLFTVNLGILPEKYYERYAITSGKFDFQLLEMLIRVIVLIIIFMQIKILKKDNSNNFIINMLIMDLLLRQVGNYQQYAYRISLYFSIYMVLMVPIIIKTTKKNKTIYSLLFLLMFLFYWYYIYVFRGAHETVPYKFNIYS